MCKLWLWMLTHASCVAAMQVKAELAARADLERSVEEMKAELEVVSRGKLEEATAALAAETVNREKLDEELRGIKERMTASEEAAKAKTAEMATALKKAQDYIGQLMNERGQIDKKFHEMKSDLITRLQNACAQRDEARGRVLELEDLMSKQSEALQVRVCTYVGAVGACWFVGMHGHSLVGFVALCCGASEAGGVHIPLTSLPRHAPGTCSPRIARLPRPLLRRAPRQRCRPCSPPPPRLPRAPQQRPARTCHPPRLPAPCRACCRSCRRTRQVSTLPRLKSGIAVCAEPVPRPEYVTAVLRFPLEFLANAVCGALLSGVARNMADNISGLFKDGAPVRPRGEGEEMR